MSVSSTNLQKESASPRCEAHKLRSLTKTLNQMAALESRSSLLSPPILDGWFGGWIANFVQIHWATSLWLPILLPNHPFLFFESIRESRIKRSSHIKEIQAGEDKDLSPRVMHRLNTFWWDGFGGLDVLR